MSRRHCDGSGRGPGASSGALAWCPVHGAGVDVTVTGLCRAEIGGRTEPGFPRRCELRATGPGADAAGRALAREPTQAEGDIHEGGEPTRAQGECFVDGWTGRRCRICRRWVWGGPTACVQCVCAEVAERGRAELRVRLRAELSRARTPGTGE